MRAHELLRSLWENGADEVTATATGVRVKWQSKPQDALRTAFDAGKEELGQWLKSENRAGRQYLWGAFVGDLICLADDEAVKGSPEGIVSYTYREVENLSGVDEKNIKLIHAAKRVFGGSVDLSEAV